MSAWLLTLFLVACAGGPEGGGGDTDAEEETQPDPRSLVEVALVMPGSVGSHLVGSATVESEAQATLVPEATGVVTGIYVEEGDRVTKGQLLAALSNPTLEGGFSRASAELERATRDVEAARRLFSQGAISKAELDLAETTLTGARTAHAEATQTKGFTRLESPINGTVATRNLRFGEVAGGQPAFVIVDLDRLRVVVSLPERDAAAVRAGLPAKLVSAYDDKSVATGSVLRVSPVIEATSGTFRTTIAVDPGQSTLRPGQFVSVRIEVDRHENVLTVPRRALVWDEGKPFVYRVAEMTPEEVAKEAEDKKKLEEKAEGGGGKGGGMSFSFGGGDTDEKKEPELPGPKRKAVRVAVTIGFEDGELAEVTSGLKVGEQVVTVGNEALRDGARVRLPGDPTIATKTEEAPAEPKPAEAG